MNRDRPAPRFVDLAPMARAFVAIVAVVGAIAVTAALVARPPAADPRWALFVALSAAAGLVKVPLPIVGSLSLAYAAVLATMLGFDLGASCLGAYLSALGSGVLGTGDGRQPAPHRTMFNAGSLALSALVAGIAYSAAGGSVGNFDPVVGLGPLLAYSAVFAAINLGLIAVAIQFSGQGEAWEALTSNLRWALPSYAAGTALGALIVLLLDRGNLATLVLAAPFAYLVHLAYRTRTRQVAEARRHSEERANLYLGITESLARAIEAKDQHTEDHLQRVRVYCVGLATRLGLPATEVEALRAASMLHDIGKIAVPERILVKPGRLTEEEMAIMRTHAAIGAEILAAVPFPYPLATLVRHHHERWDGRGYPDGLAGAAIPLGARILTVVDCFDALTSDRPYRDALPQEGALAYLRENAGTMFDPRVVEALERHVGELEREVEKLAPPSRVPRVAPHARPSLPIASPAAVDADPEEARELEELTRIATLDLAPEDRLVLFAARLRSVVPFLAMAWWRLAPDRRTIAVEFAWGHSARQIRSLTLNVGDRASGWVVEQQRPCSARSHENPVERDGFRCDLDDLERDAEPAALRSQLSVPVQRDGARLGVLALYHDAAFEYGSSHLRSTVLAADALAAALVPRPEPGTATLLRENYK